MLGLDWAGWRKGEGGGGRQARRMILKVWGDQITVVGMQIKIVCVLALKLFEDI